MEETKRVLGIDPGTGRLGWAIVETTKKGRLYCNGSKTLLDCGCIETKANTPLPERLNLIYEKITGLISQYQPSDIAIEELFFVKNVKTGISVAHARGVVMLAAAQKDLNIFEYKPNQIKIAITGYGHASKDQICKMLKLHLKGCNIKQDDTADAIAVALTHLQVRS